MFPPRIFLPLAALILTFSFAGFASADANTYARGASYIGSFPNKCDGGEIVRRDYFETDAGNGFSSPVPQASPLFEQCRFAVSIKGNRAKYAYKHCWADGDCQWIDSKQDLYRSSHGQVHGRCGYSAYFGSWEDGLYVCWMEDNGAQASRWRQEANAYRRDDQVERRDVRRAPQSQVGRKCRAPGSPGERIDLHREVQFDVEGGNSEYWFCVDLTGEDRAIEVHTYAGPQLTPGFTGRGRGRLDIALFKDSEQMDYGSSSSGRGGHHYSSGKVSRV